MNMKKMRQLAGVERTLPSLVEALESLREATEPYSLAMQHEAGVGIDDLHDKKTKVLWGKMQKFLRTHGWKRKSAGEDAKMVVSRNGNLALVSVKNRSPTIRAWRGAPTPAQISTVQKLAASFFQSEGIPVPHMSPGKPYPTDAEHKEKWAAAKAKLKDVAKKAAPVLHKMDSWAEDLGGINATLDKIGSTVPWTEREATALIAKKRGAVKRAIDAIRNAKSVLAEL